MMRRLAEDASHIFLACGATDFRKQISGLVSIVSMQFKLDPFQGTCVFIVSASKDGVVHFPSIPAILIDII